MIDRIHSSVVFDNDTYLEEGDYAYINMAVFCIAMHCLPSPGGYWDQDPVDLLVMTTVRAAQHEREELRANQRS
jgi:hypothetical protein